MDRIKAAVVQVCSTEDTPANLDRAEALVRAAAADGATLICVPENVGYLKFTSRRDPGEPLASSVIVERFSQLAVECEAAILVGSFHRSGDDPMRTWNTSVLLDGSGAVVAVYDKIHLFDIEIPGQVCFRESDDIIAGTAPVLATIGDTTIGMSVCYDLRFPELYRHLAAHGAEILTVPAAFTLQTGKDHWEVLLRARAIENQCYVLAPGQWGAHGGKRHSYGHSMIIDPWGHVIARSSDGDGWASAWLEPEHLITIRRNLPCADHRRL